MGEYSDAPRLDHKSDFYFQKETDDFIALSSRRNDKLGPDSRKSMKLARFEKREP